MYPNQPYFQGGNSGGGGWPPQQPAYGAQQYSYGQTGGYGAPQGNDQRAQRLNQIGQKYNIHPQFISRLHALANYEVVLLCDDSGSMNTQVMGTNQTRWDELKSVVSLAVEITAVMDSNGVDVYFLNREPMLNLTDVRYVQQAFQMPPNGMTPLVRALRRIIAAKQNQTYGKNLLILIATDGAPTNDYGQLDIAALEGVLRCERSPSMHVTFLACTDDRQAISYLSNWDKMIPNVDVMDDYRSELSEIQRTRGPTFPFSFGDYIVKCLLGSIDRWFDSLDDRA